MGREDPMIARTRACVRLAMVLPLAIACARSGAKSGDSAAAAAVDSASPPPPPPTVTPAPAPAADSTAKAPPPSTGSPRPPAATPAPTPTPMPTETVLTGRVTVGGLASDQRTVLQIEGGSPTTLTGPLETELRRLNAATVWVTGGPVSGPPNATFAVSRYEIVAIEGAKPVVGVLRSRDGAIWLVAERDTLKLSATTPEMRAKVGAKVWVLGRRAGAELTPQSFGVIREP